MKAPRYKWAEDMTLANLFFCAEASANIAVEYDAELARQVRWSRDRMDEWDERFKLVTKQST